MYGLLISAIIFFGSIVGFFGILSYARDLLRQVTSQKPPERLSENWSQCALALKEDE
jgi:hypothetical protein